MIDANKIATEVATQIIKEENIARRKVVVYPGRFQPMHPGHYGLYKHLVDKFGKDNVFIGTSNKVNKPRSPFNFREKQRIMTKLFGIPKNKIVQVKSPYAPKEIMSKFDKDEVAYITVISQKDKGRLGGSYFEDYREDKDLLSYGEKGYVYVAPMFSGGVSGTEVRSKLGEPSSSEEIKKMEFKRIYGKLDKKMFDLITDKLTESVIMEWLIERNGQLFEIPKADVKKVDKYADKQLDPIDIDLNSNHFFQRLNDPRNDKDISMAELIGFFKRLKRNKNEFIDFLNKYKQIVVTDNRSKLNIPFMKKANKAIAKTIMRKPNFKTSNPKITVEAQFTINPGFKFVAKKSLKNLKKGAKYVVNDIKGRIGDLTVLVNKVGDSTVIPINVRSEAEFYADVIDESIYEEVLQEGGAYGHMAHPFDLDIDLTFGDLKNIVNLALEGKLELTTEKLDGMALAISWRDDKGGLIAARNKSHLKNSGVGAMDIDDVKSKFAGRGALTDAYEYAVKDLENAISKLSDKQREKIFQNGSSFMNVEVIYPESANVIPYNHSMLVFHGTMQYDEDGNAIGENKEAGRILAGMIKQVNADVQEYYNISGPVVQKLPKSEDLSKKKPKFLKAINKLQKEFKLRDNDGVGEYHQAWWENWVDENAPRELDNKTKMHLVKRWAFFDRSNRINGKTMPDDEILDWAKKVDKQKHDKIASKNLRKFETIFLALGAEVLSYMSSAITANPDEAVQKMKDRLDKTIKDIKKSGDEKDISKLQKELERLEKAGGTDKLVPNEGIVFNYKGNTLKLTGTFAPLNQILGMMYRK